MIHRPIQQGHAVFRTGFGEHIAHVVIHGALADHQPFADLLVGQPLGHQIDDLQFALREIHPRPLAEAPL